MVVKFINTSQDYQILIFLALIISNWSFCQDTSLEYLEVLNADNSIEEKARQFDTLLKKHTINQDYDLLLADRYEILKWYYKQGQIEKTIQLNRANLALMDSLQIKDYALIRKNTYSLGYYLRKNNEIEQATKLFNTLIQTDNVDELSFKSYSSLAQMAYENDDFYEAATLYENGRELAKNEDNLDYILSFSQGAGYAYKVIKTEKSLNRGVLITKGAITLLEQKRDLTIRDNYFLYNLYDLLGNLYNDRVDYDFETSLYNYLKAEKIAKSLKDSLRLSIVYHDIGYLYLHENKKEAIAYFDKSFSFKPDISMISQLHRNKAEYYVKNKKKQKALTHIQKSIHALTSIDTTRHESLPTIEDLKKEEHKFLMLSSLIDKAIIWIELSDQDPDKEEVSLRNALATLQLADEFVDVIRLVSTEQKSKLFWRQTASEIYVNATKVCFKLNLPEDAFYFIEKNKALLLLEDINKKQLLKNSTVPESIRNREALLSSHILKANSADSDNDVSIKAKNDYRRFIDSIDNNYALFFKVQQPAEVMDLQTLQHNLETNHAYLEFIIDDENGYGLLITNEHIKFYEINGCDLLKQNVKQFLNLLKQPQLTLSAQKDYSRVSNSIYQSLFPESLKPLIKNKSLTIVPDYYLQNIPFEALQTDQSDHSYMIFKNEINYAYSATLLHRNKEQIKGDNDYKLIGFAPVDFKALPSLKNSKAELEHIEDILDSNLYIERDATTSNFTDNINNYNIIHIASHASSGTKDDVDPWIAFSDSRLHLTELHSLEHKAELVVLSACETSLGETYKGEGVMSLTRGFFNSGAHSVVSTLWKINDKPSTEIITNFYSNLDKGYNKASALHEAKLKYIESSELSEKSPYYWASFVLVGDVSPLDTSDSSNTIYYLILTFLIIIIAFFTLRKKS